jgi:catechol-2,3-dioxygenase
MASPAKLAHVVLFTSQLSSMKDWYLKVLDARVAHENQALAFLTYDDEHHRIALSDPEATAEIAKQVASTAEGLVDTPTGPLSKLSPADLAALPPHGLAHIAFTYTSLADLIDNYERLKDLSILPAITINHGPTTSMYYRDPDSNQIELQVDNFDTVEEGAAFLESDSFRKNPVGVVFDADDMAARLHAGESEAVLKAPTW